MPDFTPRPTIYKGIKMRSRLEAGYAQWLDTMGMEWEYEPSAFGSEIGQYLPDFLLPQLQVSWRREPAPGYIEVKPTPEAIHEGLAAQMSVIHQSIPEAVLFVQTPDHLYLLDYLEPVGPVFRKDAIWVTGAAKDNNPAPTDVSEVEWLIAIPLATSHLPWQGDWWKGPRAPH